ncbi:MAG: glycosyltransferase family 2 protein [Pseudomonadota bacterium]
MKNELEGSSALGCGVSVIVPVYNEAKTVGQVVDRLLAQSIVSQVIAIDDGSDHDLGLGKINDPRFVLLRHPTNRGKGAAIRTGLQQATGCVVVIQDADFEYTPEAIPFLVEPILTGKADVCYGSRFAGGQIAPTPRVRRIANGVLTWLSNYATGLSLSDMETGHKAFRRELLEGIEIREKRFGIEPEITTKLARMNARFAEIPVSYAPRSYTEGKKIGVRDGLRALWCIFRYRLGD